MKLLNKRYIILFCWFFSNFCGLGDVENSRVLDAHKKSVIQRLNFLTCLKSVSSRLSSWGLPVCMSVDEIEQDIKNLENRMGVINSE